MASTYITSFFPGNSFFTGDTDPNGVLSAPRGSQLIRTDAGNVRSYLNIDGVTAWAYSPAIDAGGDLSLVGVDQILLTDNSATALSFGSTGKLNLLVFNTLNGAEQVEYNGPLPFLINSGGLNVLTGTVTLPTSSLNVALAAAPISSGVVGASLELRVSYPAGAGPTDIVLPARGLRVTDARLVSGGAGGTVQVQTAAAAVVTDAMAPGAAGALTRAASITNQSFVSGATIRIAGAAGTVAGNVYITFEPT
jgi:hypothetical protein